VALTTINDAVLRVGELLIPIVKAANGSAIHIRNIAVVTQGPKIGLGQIGRSTRLADGSILDNPDTVEGIVLLQKGKDSNPVLTGIHDEVNKLNNGLLPHGVRVKPFLDRSDLVAFTVKTVKDNLTWDSKNPNPHFTANPPTCQQAPQARPTRSFRSPLFPLPFCIPFPLNPAQSPQGKTSGHNSIHSERNALTSFAGGFYPCIFKERANPLSS
jgi:hypothetical protein